MAEQEQPSGAEQAAERAARNTAVRAAGDITGKLLSLLLFALLARSVSQSSLGVYVFAFAWVQIATVPIGLGFDRFLVRRIAKEGRAAIDALFWNVLRMKALRALPVVAVSWIVATILHHDTQTRLAVYVLTFGLLFDLLMRTVHSVFTGLERGELTATVVVCQRFANAALGIAALAVGWGVLGVAASYTVSSAFAFAIAFALMARRVGMPRPDFSREHRVDLRRSSLPFAAQDVFLALLDKLDAVVLSLLAVEAAVGRYGAAYRLLEATYFISSAMTASFSAMFTYLGHDTDPTVRAVYQRSIKLSLAALVPCGVACGVLAVPLARAFFGANLVSAAEPLRLLSPVIPLMGVVVLSISLVVSRGNPRTMAVMIFAAVGVNLALNVALIPLWQDRGAATAMLVTYVVFLGLTVRLAIRAVGGGVEWLPTVTGPLVAGAVMGVVAWPLSSLLPVALVVSGLTYFAVLIAIERRTNPGEVEMVVRIMRRRLPFLAPRRASSRA